MSHHEIVDSNEFNRIQKSILKKHNMSLRHAPLMYPCTLVLPEEDQNMTDGDKIFIPNSYIYDVEEEKIQTVA